MRYIFSIIMFTGAVMAGSFAIRALWSKEKKNIMDILYVLLCVASSIWGFGFAVLYMLENPDNAYICRSVALIGVVLYLIAAQMLMCHVADMRKNRRIVFDAIALSGIIVYFLAIQKDIVEFKVEDSGLTYYFKSNIGNDLYTVYTVVIAICVLGMAIYTARKAKLKRTRVFGKKIICVTVIMIIGTTLDTVFPLVGRPAFPGGSVAQILSTFAIYFAMQDVKRSNITLKNMSELIYISMAIPGLVYDMDRKIKIINDAAVDFFSDNRERVERENIEIDTFFEIAADAVFNFEGEHRDLEAVCKNNGAYCNLSVNKMRDRYGDMVGYIILVADLTEKRKNISELEKAVRRADDANRAKSTFLAKMSHEIRTPMNAIIGFSELILNEELSEQAREYAGDIQAASQNLLAIINDILDISKIESGKMELVCKDYYSAGMFKDVFLIVDNQAKKKGLTFNMTVAQDVPGKMYGDKVRIRSVLINLLNNAVKYTNEGSVSLKVRMLKKDHDVATLEFKVSDTGIGIAEEDLDKLFENFSQVDKVVNYGKEGTGLGLAIVKGFVTLMGGEVSVSSVYGEGSTFTITINQKIVDEDNSDRTYDREEATRSNYSLGDMKISDVKVLVVDDNRVNLKMAGKSMEHYGFEVETADSGMEAIELCKKNHYHMIFMDQMMPQMDGIEAMKEIRKLDPYYDFGGECKIIILTANTISGVRDQLIEQGFDEFMGKPMNFKQLERIILKFIPKEKIDRE